MIRHDLARPVVDDGERAGVLDRHEGEGAVGGQPVVPVVEWPGMPTIVTAKLSVSRSEIWAGVPRSVTTSVWPSFVSCRVSGMAPTTASRPVSTGQSPPRSSSLILFSRRTDT
jgi:hypothetical protein